MVEQVQVAWQTKQVRSTPGSKFIKQFQKLLHEKIKWQHKGNHKGTLVLLRFDFQDNPTGVLYICWLTENSCSRQIAGANEGGADSYICSREINNDRVEIPQIVK